MNALSDAPVVRCPQFVDVERPGLLNDVSRTVTLSCDVESHPTSTVHWRCCGTDRDVPDTVVYEKVCACGDFVVFSFPLLIRRKGRLLSVSQIHNLVVSFGSFVVLQLHINTNTFNVGRECYTSKIFETAAAGKTRDAQYYLEIIRIGTFNDCLYFTCVVTKLPIKRSSVHRH